MKLKFVFAPLIFCACVFTSRPGLTQAAPERDETWDTVTLATALGAFGVELLMPRVFYSSPEVTVGWKTRWHVSALAPSMTMAALALLNETTLKDAFEDPRPGCEDLDPTTPGCETFGLFSTHTFTAFSALGQGAAVFIFDMTKYSDGRFNAGSLVGHVVVPLVLGTVTAVGRSAGDWESGGQILASAGTGLAAGFLMGMTYVLMQPPECGYTGALICW
jgi:hypothetical protein